MVLNEFFAFKDLAGLKPNLDPTVFTIATFALCGFANISSVGIQIGGIGALVPDRKHDLARLGFRRDRRTLAISCPPHSRGSCCERRVRAQPTPSRGALASSSRAPRSCSARASPAWPTRCATPCGSRTRISRASPSRARRATRASWSAERSRACRSWCRAVAFICMRSRAEVAALPTRVFAALAPPRSWSRTRRAAFVSPSARPC